MVDEAGEASSREPRDSPVALGGPTSADPGTGDRAHGEREPSRTPCVVRAKASDQHGRAGLAMTGSGVVETSHSDSVSTFSRLPR